MAAVANVTSAAAELEAVRRRADGLREQIWKRKDALNDTSRTRRRPPRPRTLANGLIATGPPPARPPPSRAPPQ